MIESKIKIHRYSSKRDVVVTKTIIVVTIAIWFTMVQLGSTFTANIRKLSHQNLWRPTINRCVADQLWTKEHVRFRSTRRNLIMDSDDDLDYGQPPLLVVEGLFAVDKPVDWTSQDVVSFIRGIYERDARLRGVKHGKVGSRKNKDKIIRCGHGGTLDPLATGVLVLGLGSGTKLLQSYLKGTKGYHAEGEFGFETTTLDMAGSVTKNEKFDHITRENVEAVIPHFTGKFLQDPPIYSAIHKEGKRLHQLARMGMTAEDVQIEPRAVEVYDLKLLDFNLPKFEIEVTSASGLYVRSLIRDIGYSVDSVATTTKLRRIKHGPFTLEQSLPREDWTVEKINEVMESFNSVVVAEDEETVSI